MDRLKVHVERDEALRLNEYHFDIDGQKYWFCHFDQGTKRDKGAEKDNLVLNPYKVPPFGRKEV